MKEVTKEKYAQFFNTNKDQLKVIESFSDPTGESEFGYGYPYMDTYWGIKDEKLARCIMIKESIDEDYIHQYFLKQYEQK